MFLVASPCRKHLPYNMQGGLIRPMHLQKKQQDSLKEVLLVNQRVWVV